MRIIGGKHRGRRLATVRGEIRPTTDRARECLFNVLDKTVVGSVWLDAFSGTGAVGIEALSRGAEFINFNDRSFAAVRLLKKNLKLCGIEGGWEVQQKDVFILLRRSGITASGLRLPGPALSLQATPETTRSSKPVTLLEGGDPDNPRDLQEDPNTPFTRRSLPFAGGEGGGQSAPGSCKRHVEVDP